MYRFIIVDEEGQVSTGDVTSHDRCWKIFLSATDFIYKAVLQKEGHTWKKLTATTK